MSSAAKGLLAEIEADILAKKLVGPKSALKILICRPLGEITPEKKK
jgi:hypothetical protein